MNNFEEFVKNEIIVIQWVNALQLISAMQKRGLYNLLLDDTNYYGKIMQVLEEYNDIIFGDDFNE